MTILILKLFTPLCLILAHTVHQLFASFFTTSKVKCIEYDYKEKAINSYICRLELLELLIFEEFS